MEHTKTLIIGAGPAGMAAAMELHKKGKDFIMLERQKQVGGLAKTYIIQEGDLEFRTDNGPHRFFSKNTYLYQFVGELLNEKWILVKRQTRQYIQGQYFDYPINFYQVAKNLGMASIIKAGIDYGIASVRYKALKKPINNFYDYAMANFGKTIANLNIIGYTEKIWGVDTRLLHANWAKQRVAGLNLVAMVKNIIQRTLKRHDTTVKSMVDVFYYPESGTGLIYETIKQRIEGNEKKIFLQSFPTKIHHQHNRITKVTAMRDNSPCEIALDWLVESVHVDDFLKLLSPLPPPEVLEAASNLKYRSQVYLFITLNKERVTNDQWIYFPDPAIPFSRISEMKNFSRTMSPPGKTSLWVEFFCNESDQYWNMSKDESLSLSLPYFEKIGLFRKEEVRNTYLFKGGKDYPIYDLEYEQHMKIIKGYLDSFANLYYIGRPGRFQYTNQDHSLEMGILAAKGIIDNQKINVEGRESEAKYFEAGKIPVKS